MCMPASRGGTVVRALTSHQRDLGFWTPVLKPAYMSWVSCWFSPLFFEVFLHISLLLTNQHFQIPIRFRNAQRHFNKFSRTPKCSVGTKKKFTIFTVAYHTSTFSEQGSFLITSGAIHATVPAKVILALLSLNSLLVPKSDILSISSAPTRTL